MADNREIDPDVVPFLGRLLEEWTNGGGVAEAVGDGLTRDGILEVLVSVVSSDQWGEDTDEALAHYSALLTRQPPFRLERDGDGNVHLVLIAGDRRVYSWTPAVGETIDAEVIASLGEGLKNLVRQGMGSESAGGPTGAPKTEPQELAGSGKGAVTERAGRVVGMLRTRLETSNPLTEWIGAGKSRDELLEMSLPGLPEEAQTVLADKLNEQPPFRVECGEDGSVSLLLIVSGECVHTWTPEDLGVPPSRSWWRIWWRIWRIIGYSVFGAYFGAFFVLFMVTGDWKPASRWGLYESLTGAAIPLVLYGTLDGFFYLRRTRGREMAWCAYWAVPVLLVVVSLTLPESGVAAVVAFFMVIAGLGYLLATLLATRTVLYPFTRGRDLLECPSCGAVTKHSDRNSVWLYAQYVTVCRICGAEGEPLETGRRASFRGRVG